MFRRQKGELTRAKNSGDPAKIRATVKKHVVEWTEGGFPWPDSWATWNCALRDSARSWHSWEDIDDLLAEYRSEQLATATEQFSEAEWRNAVTSSKTTLGYNAWALSQKEQ
jgi:hypothetical protein